MIDDRRPDARVLRKRYIRCCMRPAMSSRSRSLLGRFHRPRSIAYREVIQRPCDACETSDGCVLHFLFTCASCGRRTSWSDGCDTCEEGCCGDVCTTCWCRRHPDQAGGAIQASGSIQAGSRSSVTLDDVYAEGDRERALDLVLDMIDRLLLESLIDQVDDLLREVDPSRLETVVALGFLSTTRVAAPRLANRDALVARISEVLRGRGDDVEQLVVPLQSPLLPW